MHQTKTIPFPYIYIMYTDASNNTPSSAHVSLYVIWRFHPKVENWTKLLGPTSLLSTNKIAWLWSNFLLSWTLEKTQPTNLVNQLI